ncbi:MAG TPA: fatty acid desaturase [Tepidisphaeraceae bacterium]|nr:fatty acid desaturase [Tepidisphaeraceae bacterium]
MMQRLQHAPPTGPPAPAVVDDNACADENARGGKKARQIRWYRTPIEPQLPRKLNRRSDVLGAAQTLGFLGAYAATAGLATYSAAQWNGYVTAPLVFLHGTVAAFMINGVHELGHNTVFRSRWLNGMFVRVLAFLGWINFQIFGQSHGRHHAYTLHPPDDLEVVLPIKLAVRHFFARGFINVPGFLATVRDTVRIAVGRFQGDWELTLYPQDDAHRRRAAVRWARALLIGHGLIMTVSLALGWWMVPVLVTLGPFYGGWLFFLCNNTQHIGLKDNVPDFRLYCRTIHLNPLVRLLYWQMNYHTEHHMYPTVPCYRLGRLHRAVAPDLPPCPRGLLQTWRQIAAILRKQRDDPAYQYQAIIPVRPSLTGGF